jgi:acetyl-CoA carboxylase biotin carboxyl carrier protein
MNENRTEKDVKFIEALADLLERNGLSEISVKRKYDEHDSLQVRVSKQTTAPAVTTAPAPPAAAAPPPATAPAAPDSEPPAAGISDPAQHPGAVTSPMVGTAYLSAEPGADPFVTVGAQVSEGQTLLIIEAMKTMNHIPAPRSGTVKRILISDASPVEYGAPLMIIE